MSVFEVVTMGVPAQAHLADPFVKVKGLLTDLINFGSLPLANDGFYCTFAAREGGDCGIRSTEIDVWFLWRCRSGRS